MPNHHASRQPRAKREGEFPGRDDKYERCPDCEENSAAVGSTELSPLDLLGRVRFDPDRAIPRTLGCETCGGTGRVLKKRTADGRPRDEYELPKKG